MDGPCTSVAIFSHHRGEELSPEEKVAVQQHAFLLGQLVVCLGLVFCAAVTCWVIAITSGQPAQALSAQAEIHETILSLELRAWPGLPRHFDAAHTVCVYVDEALEGEAPAFSSWHTPQKLESYGQCKARMLEEGQKQHFIKLGMVNWLYGHRAQVVVNRGQDIHYTLRRAGNTWRVIERRVQLKQT